MRVQQLGLSKLMETLIVKETDRKEIQGEWTCRWVSHVRVYGACEC